MTWILPWNIIFLLSLCSALPTKDCVQSKTVGDTCYELLYKIPEPFANCLDGCVYKEISDSSSSPKRICFAIGNLPVTNECLGCPAMNMTWTGKPTVTKPASTWEKCGNLCFQDQERCKVGWTWTEEAFYKGSCSLYSNSKLMPNQEGAVSGTPFCPVEDCDHHHFTTWWDVVSPCFKKRVENQPINNPELCIPEPNPTMKTKIDDSIQALNTTVYDSEELLALVDNMYGNVPTDYVEYCPGDFDAMITYLKVVVMIPPPFLIDAANYIGVPITTVVLCFLHTQEGRKFFANPKVNEKMRTLVNVYAEVLNSSDSKSVFNNGQYGWTSTCANRLVNYEEFHGSFKSFNDFFTRDIKDVKTNRPLDNGDYVLTAPGDVALSYHAMNVDFNNSLYMKNEKYSLLQIFNNEPSVAQPFVGGAILQVYFSASKYHGYHAPISGQIIYAEKVPGIIYAIDKVNAAKNNDLTGGKSVSSQEKLDLWLELGQNGIIDTEFYLAHVATRCVYVIDSPILGNVGMVFIGMTEISSCTMVKAKGENVEKGEKLGNFQFGGSSGVIVVQKEAVDESKMGEKGDNIWRDITGKWLMGQKLVDLTPL